MNAKEAVKEVRQPDYPRIWYKYDGHGGYQPPEEGWRKGVACFSTVCKDETKTLCRISNPRKDVTKEQWKDMVRMVKKVSSGVRKCLVENPPSYEEHTMMFNSGRGYSDYFAFTLFRMFYYDYAMFKVIQYLHQTAEYHLVDAYILAGVYRPKNWWEGTHYMIVGKACQNKFLQKGIAKRLKNASRFRNIRPYGMRLAIQGLSRNGRMEVDGLNLTMANLKKTDYLDRIVTHINS
jgi:hypothetical protein